MGRNACIRYIMQQEQFFRVGAFLNDGGTFSVALGAEQESVGGAVVLSILMLVRVQWLRVRPFESRPACVAAISSTIA
jgi:hypothetical protein